MINRQTPQMNEDKSFKLQEEFLEFIFTNVRNFFCDGSSNVAHEFMSVDSNFNDVIKKGTKWRD